MGCINTYVCMVIGFCIVAMILIYKEVLSSI